VRLDHQITNNWKAFFRFSATPSNSQTRQGGNFVDPAVVSAVDFTVRTYTAAVDGNLSQKVSNEFRVNYSSNEGVNSQSADGFGGGQKVDLRAMQGIDTANDPASSVGVLLNFPGFLAPLSASRDTDHQKQWNVVDIMNISAGKHLWRVGVDY